MTDFINNQRTLSDAPEIHAVILAGGSGSRLWPLSRQHLPKQFLALEGEATLLQTTIDRLSPTIQKQNVLIVTQEAHAIPCDIGWNDVGSWQAVHDISAKDENSFMQQYPIVGFNNYFSESSRVLDYQFFKKALDYIKPEHQIFILNVYETQLLFHILPPDDYNYWGKRIQHLPLPPGFNYK